MYWINKIFAIFIILILNITLTFFGKFLLGIFKIRRPSYFESIITAFGLGSGVAGLSIFIVGALFSVSPVTLIVFLLILTFFAISHIWIERKIISNAARKLKPKNFDIFAKLLTFFTILLFLHNLYRGIWPDSDFDSLWYHLTEPKLYLMWEKIRFIRGGLLYYSAMPQLVEMLYMIGLFFKGVIGAKVIHSFFGLWCFALAFLWGRDLTKKNVSGFFAGLIFYASNIVFWESQNAYIDLAVTFYTSLGLYFYFKYFKKSNLSFLILSSIFLGFAIGSKLLSVYFVIIILIANFVFKISSLKNDRKLLIKESLIILIIPLLLWLPWGIYSYIKTRNPFYPLLEGVFNKNDWFSTTQLSGLSQIGWLKLQFQNLLQFPDNVLHDESGYPAILMFSFFAAVLTFFHEKKVKTAALIFLIFTLFWNFTPARGSRFFLPITLMMAVFGAKFLTSVVQKGISQKILAILLVTFSSISQFLNFYFMFKPRVWVYSERTEQEFLMQNVAQNTWGFYDYNGKVGEIVQEEKVLVYNIHNLFYLNFNFDEVSYLPIKHELFGNQAEIETYLKQNYSYVLIKRAGLIELSNELGIADFSEDFLTLIFDDNVSQIKLYKIQK